jgi:hypothetical protein
MQSYVMPSSGDGGVLAQRIQGDLDALSIDDFERAYDITGEDVYTREVQHPAPRFRDDARKRPLRALLAIAFGLTCAVELIACGVLVLFRRARVTGAQIGSYARLRSRRAVPVVGFRRSNASIRATTGHVEVLVHT